MAHRRLALFLVVLLAAVPLAGCMDLVNAGEKGYGENWSLGLIQADILQGKGLTGAGVKVAIIDTGIDLNHPEFKGRTVEWADLVNRRADPYDDNGHGTHVAGIIAAQGRWGTIWSGFVLQGVAPDVSLIIIKAIDADGKGDESRVATGVNTAVQNGADIIVLSLGGNTRAIFGTNTENAVKSAINKGVYVVAAAGNREEGQNDCTVTSPASVQGVIAVGAIGRNEIIGEFSCRGSGKEGSGSVVPGIGNPTTNSRNPDKKPEVVAPGVDIVSSWTGNGYASASGTSQAAPMVGGILALILQSKPELQAGGSANNGAPTIDNIKQKLMITSRKIGPLAGQGTTAHDDRYGYGLIQGDALLRAL